jgi:hypothetical protein
MQSVIHINKYGDREWFVNNLRHRTDGPAIERSCGTLEWWIDGQLHREDGPAIIYGDGDQAWYVRGRFHRTNGPALDYRCLKMWYKNGKFHRGGGPAMAFADGTREWWYNDFKETREANRAREYCRIKSYMINVRLWLPIESSGSLRYPMVDLILGYL